MASEGEKPKVAILGAGFAGIYTAINLTKSLGPDEADILLVDSNYYHLFKPMLHEVATGGVEPNSIIQPIKEIMKGRNFTFLEGMVQGIDLEKRGVKICQECEGCTKLKDCIVEDFGLKMEDIIKVRRQEVGYDYLVIAMGGSPNYFGIPGAEEFTYPLWSIKDATALRKRITDAFKVATYVDDRGLREKILTFVVVGAGPTGIEFISSLNDLVYSTLISEFPVRANEITLYLVEAGKDILPLSDEKTRARAREQLASTIEVLTGSSITKVTRSYVEKRDKRIDTFTTIWTAGVRGNKILEDTGLELDGLGRAVVDEYLGCADHEGVFALGDCAKFIPPGLDHPLPQTGQVAVQEARCVVDNIVADIRGHKRCSFRYREMGSSFSIGKYNALSDVMGVLKIGGLFGWLIWKVIYLKHLWGIRRGFRGTLEWFLDITYDREASRHKFSK